MAAPHSTDIATQLALLNERVANLTTKLEEVESDLHALTEMASRWKGGFLVIVGLGGLVGWLASLWDKVAKWH